MSGTLMHKDDEAFIRSGVFYYQGGGNEDPDPSGAYVSVGLLPGDDIPTEVWVSWGDVCNIKDGRPCYSCRRARTLRMGKVVVELIAGSMLERLLKALVPQRQLGGGGDA